MPNFVQYQEIFMLVNRLQLSTPMSLVCRTISFCHYGGKVALLGNLMWIVDTPLTPYCDPICLSTGSEVIEKLSIAREFHR